MLLANKMVLEFVRYPSVVAVIQIIFATSFVIIIKICGVKVDELDLTKMKAYLIYISLFIGMIYTSMSALAVSNIETVIVFRACTPIGASLIEYLFMGRQLPSLRSATSFFNVMSE